MHVVLWSHVLAAHFMPRVSACMHGANNTHTCRSVKEELEEAVFMPLRYPHL